MWMILTSIDAIYLHNGALWSLSLASLVIATMKSLSNFNVAILNSALRFTIHQRLVTSTSQLIATLAVADDGLKSVYRPLDLLSP
jgi:hypothetical protein